MEDDWTWCRCRSGLGRLSILCGYGFEGWMGVLYDRGFEDWLGVLCDHGEHVLFKTLFHGLCDGCDISLRISMNR